MVEPDKHQGLIIPKGFSFNFHPERVVTKAHNTISGSNSTAEQQLVTTGSNKQSSEPSLVSYAVVCVSIKFYTLVFLKR